ncbi:MAG: hypothetical protein II937_09970 [Bacteroidales bacterium]|nr:hypothetical protein [Bacteroidales bacterium]
MQSLFDIAAFERAGFKHESERPAHFCRTCEHREPWQCGSKIIQYCRKLKSNRTDNGLKKIKCKQQACIYYSEKKLNKMNKIQELNAEMVLAANEDPESAHIKADDIIIKALEYLADEAGFNEDITLLIGNYNAIQKWYA